MIYDTNGLATRSAVNVPALTAMHPSTYCTHTNNINQEKQQTDQHRSSSSGSASISVGDVPAVCACSARCAHTCSTATHNDTQKVQIHMQYNGVSRYIIRR